MIMSRTSHTASAIGLLVFGVAFCLPTFVFAETISIISGEGDTEELVVEAEMKRHLRAEGYTVKGGTTDGYLLLLSVIQNNSRAGTKLGVTGHLTIASQSWQELGDSLVSEECKGEQGVAQAFKEVVGTRVLIIDSRMATAASEETLAVLLSTHANQKIRATSKKVTEFFSEWNAKYNRGVSLPPIEQKQ